MPGYKWASSSDQTDRLPGLTCSALEEPLPGSGWQSWNTAWNIVKLIEGLP